MQLIYRGHCYSLTATQDIPVRQLCAINWRYRLTGAAEVEILPGNCAIASPSALPRAINWRYQVPMEV